MRTWLSKSKGYVSEKTDDVWSGTLSSNNEKIYQGDFIKLTISKKIFIGKSDIYYRYKNYNENDWKTISESYTGFVQYNPNNGRFFILGPNKQYSKYGKSYQTHIEIYHNMTDKNHGYLSYQIELL